MARSEPGLIIRTGIESGYLSEGGKERIGGAIIGRGGGEGWWKGVKRARIEGYTFTTCVATARAEEDES